MHAAPARTALGASSFRATSEFAAARWRGAVMLAAGPGEHNSASANAARTLAPTSPLIVALGTSLGMKHRGLQLRTKI